ncbi:hypothetical protein BJ994_003050 [Arthrobacter pigmenti]|uniref:Uncharacterized protein n=1 Tax=Arthrobacter pigmenti TaxID=271432 RepID=A0A846RTX0_9MICC|nr:hypothetical protein [Arthrobacter pigmenti]NJC23974.1 hypothetical protein [Arthrobacter pigmenti]
MNTLGVALLSLAVLLILGGASLLLGQPSTVFAMQPIAEEASVAYSSELVVSFDVEPSLSDNLSRVGGALLVGGLMVSAGAIGWRNGRKVADDAS